MACCCELHMPVWTLEIKCPNCKGNNTGNYGRCPLYQRAEAVEKVGSEKKSPIEMLLSYGK